MLPIRDPLVVAYVAADVPQPSPWHPRSMPHAQRIELRASLRHSGQVQPILLRATDDSVINGHSVLEECRALGIASVAVIRLDVTEVQAQGLHLALNQIHGAWDRETLPELLRDRRESPEFADGIPGFPDDDIEALFAKIEAENKRDRPETFDVDAATAVAGTTATTQPGDVILLGEHRLVCGDASEDAIVESVLQGSPAEMTVTTSPTTSTTRAAPAAGAGAGSATTT